MSHELFFSNSSLCEPEGKSKGIGGGGSEGEAGVCLELCQVDLQGFTHVAPQALPPKRNPWPQICVRVHECLQVLVCSCVCVCVMHLRDSSNDELGFQGSLLL